MRFVGAFWFAERHSGPSFNSLCEIPSILKIRNAKSIQPFNSLCEIQSPLHELFHAVGHLSILFVRFLLIQKAREKNIAYATFNSLCEILFVAVASVFLFVELSILFVRFRLRNERDALLREVALSILFVRFLIMLIAEAKVLKSFNSLCEILSPAWEPSWISISLSILFVRFGVLLLVDDQGFCFLSILFVRFKLLQQHLWPKQFALSILFVRFFRQLYNREDFERSFNSLCEIL